MLSLSLYKNLIMERKTHIVDVSKKPLGRVASEIAVLLMGKHKRDYSPHIDVGDFVKVRNIKEITFTGKKKDDKFYYHHTGYPGGLKKKSYGKITENDPMMALKKAVYGMLPKNKLRKERIKRLNLEE